MLNTVLINRTYLYDLFTYYVGTNHLVAVMLVEQYARLRARLYIVVVVVNMYRCVLYLLIAR